MCMLDPAVTYCAPFKPEETVYSFLMFWVVFFFLTHVQKYDNFRQGALNCTGGTRNSQGGKRPHEVQLFQKKRGEEETNKQHILFFALDFGLLFCDANSGRVLFIYMNIL